jgi:hypothetical protein
VYAAREVRYNDLTTSEGDGRVDTITAMASPRAAWGTGGTGLTVDARGTDLAGLFGPAQVHSDDRKVSRQWVLRFRGGTFTLYDYKATSLYRPGLPDPTELLERTYGWHVGWDGRGDPAEFVRVVSELLA